MTVYVPEYHYLPLFDRKLQQCLVNIFFELLVFEQLFREITRIGNFKFLLLVLIVDIDYAAFDAAAVAAQKVYADISRKAVKPGRKAAVSLKGFQ